MNGFQSKKAMAKDKLTPQSKAPTPKPKQNFVPKMSVMRKAGRGR